MPKPQDRVQLFKQESTAGGGDGADSDPFLAKAPLDSSEDAPDMAGVYLQENGTLLGDKQVVVYRESDQLFFEDSSNQGVGRKSLSNLASAGQTPTEAGEILLSVDEGSGLVFKRVVPVVSGNGVVTDSEGCIVYVEPLP